MFEGRSADQFADPVENTSGIGMGSPMPLAYDSIVSGLKENVSVSKENPTTTPWGIPHRLSAPVGRGQMIDTMLKSCPQFNEKIVKRELDACNSLRYNDNLFKPREEIAESHKAPEVSGFNLNTNPTKASSSQSLFGLYTENPEAYYKPVDPYELNKAPGFVMNDDDFPPL